MVAFLLVDIRSGRRGRATMAQQAPLKYAFYIPATPEKAWEGFVSAESNRVMSLGAEFQAELKPCGQLAWVGAADGKTMPDVQGKVLRFGWPRILSRLKTLLETRKTFKPY